MHASRILIVDDDPLARTVLSAVLDAEPDLMVVATAGSADEGIAVAERTTPDAVLIDVNMPGGGAAAARGIAQRCPDARLVALSGSEDAETVRTMLAAGVHRYATKSGPTTELLALLRALLAPAAEDAPAPPALPARADEPIGVLVAISDGAELLALAGAVSDDPRLALVGLAQTPAHAATLAARHRPGVAVVDARLDAGGGERATAAIRAASPGTAVIALWATRDRDRMLGLLRSGARGHLEVPSPADVTAAVRDVAGGGATLSPDLAAVLVEELVSRMAPPDRVAAGSELHERIDRAARGEGLLTLLQPIVDLRRRRVVGREALTRFTLGPHRGADVWFAEAAALGRSQALELMAAKRALAQVVDLPEGEWLSVNVSPAVAVTPELAALIDQPSAGRVVLEMTEHTPVQDYTGLAEALQPLRDAGVRVAVDDAGAGFSSLRHILQLCPDFIKLDTSLCQGIGEDPARSAMARALVGFSSETGCTVIAEGIESEEDITALRRLDVPLGQGYELGRPQRPGSGRFRRP